MKKKNEAVGRLSLLAATIIWGGSFVVMKNTLDNVSPIYLLSIRFSAAAIILAVIFFRRLIGLDKRGIQMGTVMGALLFAAYLAQTFGLTDTTPGKNAFLTAVYCVVVPFLYWMISKKKPDAYHISASIVCVVGIGLVSLDGNLNMSMGDMLTLLGGVFFALHIIAVARYSQLRDIFALTVMQFASAAVFGWVCGYIFEGPPHEVPQSAFFSLIYLSVMATAVALLLQNVGQKHTHVSAAAIILSLESVFGVIFSIFIYHEEVSLRVGIGFALIFAAVIISETKLSFLKKKRAAETPGS